MRTAARLGAFGAALAVVFGAAYEVGALAGPGAASDAAPSHGRHGTHTADDGGDARTPAADEEIPAGLMVSQNGHTLQRVGADPVAGQAGEFAFRVVGPDGDPVRRYETVHDRQMHLIVVRSDLSGYRHLHPTLAADGTWRVRTTFAAGGTYRAFADFTPAGGEALTLGVDVPVAGDFRPVPLPPATEVATVDGYTVRMEGRPEAGASSMLTFRVERDGVPVTDLQPYLGAYGHLVALRAGDLAYLHVHPDGEPGDGRTAPGPEVAFHVEVPTAGTYRLFLDFRHAGAVHTAEFTLDA
jgi:hypothetical protein